MKNRIQLSIAAALLFLFAVGCNDLNQYPTDRFTDATFWTSESRAMQVVNQIYGQMFSLSTIWTDEKLSDNMVCTRSGSGYDAETIRQGGATSSLSLFSSQWSWGCIKMCNVFLENVDLVPNMDETTLNRMKAEVRFIRAFRYFRLANLYGDIPFYLHDLSIVEAREMTRTPKAEVIAALHQELEEILPYLPSKNDMSAAENGRVTKAAALMLDARLYLYDSDWANVERICNMLISQQSEYGSYSLFTTATDHYSAYENLFTSAFEYNDEIILDYAAVPVVKEWSDLIDMVPQTVEGARVTSGAPTQSLVDAYLTLNGLPVKGSVQTNPAYDTYAVDSDYNENTNMYSNRDPRMAATVVFDGYVWKDVVGGAYKESIINIKAGSNVDNAVGNGNATTTGYYTRKYFDPDHRVNLQQSNNIILMRYADVLLMYAEAMMEQNKFSESTWNLTIRPIRERAGFVKAAALDYPGTANLRAIIRNERRCELALEGLRYWDIIRWDEGTVRLNGPVYGAKFAQNNTEYLTPSTRIFNNDRDKVWAIPYNEMSKVPTLAPQNNGY